jgi:tetratricopeptide (TPR) repeat protein
MSQVTKEKTIPSQLPMVELDATPSFGDRLLESLRPHLNLILLSLGALVLLFIALAWMLQTRQRAAEGEWMTFNQQLSLMSLTGNTSGIKEISEEFPNGSAGLWGLMLAGHFELDQGLRKLGGDRKEGFREIEKAKTTLKKVVDAPADQKSALLQIRSTYCLAYTYESLGEFESAKNLYQELVDQVPDSAFGKAAKRGLKRCTDPSFAKVFEKFRGWEDPFAVAPGTPTTQKQDISFPELPESPEVEQGPAKEPGTGEASEIDSKPNGDAKPIDDAKSEEKENSESEASSSAAGESSDSPKSEEKSEEKDGGDKD